MVSRLQSTRSNLNSGIAASAQTVHTGSVSSPSRIEKYDEVAAALLIERVTRFLDVIR
jgi:hypothetical protein